jgi:hypothetical protein
MKKISNQIISIQVIVKSIYGFIAIDSSKTRFVSKRSQTIVMARPSTLVVSNSIVPQDIRKERVLKTEKFEMVRKVVE